MTRCSGLGWTLVIEMKTHMWPWWKQSAFVSNSCTYSSHIFTNPEFSTYYLFILEKIQLYWHLIIYVLNQMTNFMGKKLGFVDSGFVNKCDELVIIGQVWLWKIFGPRMKWNVCYYIWATTVQGYVKYTFSIVL